MHLRRLPNVLYRFPLLPSSELFIRLLSKRGSSKFPGTRVSKCRNQNLPLLVPVVASRSATRELGKQLTWKATAWKKGPRCRLVLLITMPRSNSVPADGGGHKREAALDRLSNILKTFNEHFGTTIRGFRSSWLRESGMISPQSCRQHPLSECERE